MAKYPPLFVGTASAAILSGLFLLYASATQAASVQTVSNFTNPGNLTMEKYIPDAMPAQAPLVVILHGCTQNGQEYLNKAGWKKLADQYKFAVLLPTQKSANNMNACFNWFEPNDIDRGKGEGASIINAMDRVIADHALDGSRVFVSGLSAGGAMTSVMLGTYPERFKGGAVNAGVVYGCARNVFSGLTCMTNPGSSTPQQFGDKVRTANPGYSGPWPTVQVFHGKNDDKVGIANLTAIMKQWTNVHGIDQTADVTGTGGNADIKRYNNAQGVSKVETYEINGMGHATVVNPGAAAEDCGEAAQYYVDGNVCSAFVSGKFWGIIVSADDGFAGGGGGTTTTTAATTSTTAGSSTSTTTASTTSTTAGACFKSSNYAHTTAGRAHQTLGITYANGSNQNMGLWNMLVITKLRQTGANYYVIDNTCP